MDVEYKQRYEELMTLDKEDLVRLYLKSERLREGQVKELSRMEKDLARYENKYSDKILDELLDSLDEETEGACV